MTFQVHNDDCLTGMANLAANSIDAIVTDPPYGLTFMGKGWDRGVPGVDYWQAALRCAKPGAHLLAFGGTRTYHRLTCAIEDAGWEIRDCLMWVYGSGFPKSHNLKGDMQGWGTALKPAWEPIIMARKSVEDTVAENVQQWGTGAINVDGCRVEAADGDYDHSGNLTKRPMARNAFAAATNGDLKVTQAPPNPLGRWPANLIHDGSDEVLGLFPQSKSCNSPSKAKPKSKFRPGQGKYPGDAGSAARFFYCAKASKADRTAGNNHPTVKPTDLMRYLCRLTTPPNGLILDPFTGSGSTGKAALLEGFNFVGFEIEAEYVAIANARCAAVANKTPLLEAI